MKKLLRDKARELRLSGKSINEITLLTGVSKSTISVWVRDIELTAEQIAALKTQQRTYAAQYKGAHTNRDHSRKLRLAWQEVGRLHARRGSSLHMMGCMLYWAEGSKERNRLQFVNSDPNMMTLFLRFLREELQVDDQLVKLRIQCHIQPVDQVSHIEQYWLQLLNLPADCLGKTHFKVGSEFRHNHLINGVCALTVHSTELVQHIYGAIQEYGGFEKPKWLD